MTTRFSLELVLDADEQLRLVQAFEYLADSETGSAVLPRELGQYLAGIGSIETSREDQFAQLIGSDPIGIDIEVIGPDKHRLRKFDRIGTPNLRMLCQIIGNFVPRILPIEFTFAVLDEQTHHFSGGLVVMTHASANIQMVDSKLKRRGKKPLH